ncbi:MAG TPA: c-type cytochrome [Candidatus Binatia bacterium]|nr:c-type cytochrome [Candidatus Binatia bacterium]
MTVPARRFGFVRLGGAVSLATLLAAGAAAMPAVDGDIEAGRRKAGACAACHGRDGHSLIPTVPSLAAQPALYTYYQLIQFQTGRRRSPEMAPFVADLSDQDMQDLSAYYAAQPAVAAPTSEPADPVKMEAGERLVSRYHCNACHLPTLGGQKHIPRLAGQQEEYLRRQLRAFKQQKAADLDGSMTMAAQPLTEEAIEALAHYLARVGPRAGGPGGQR